MSDYRIVSEDPVTGFIYYQHKTTGTVMYYGGFVGKKSGLFGDAGYWHFMLGMPNSGRMFGPFQFLDQIVPSVVDEL